MNDDSVKSALLVIALLVAGCLGGLKLVAMGLKFMSGDKILTVPDNGIK
jgi:hypothetical protein